MPKEKECTVCHKLFRGKGERCSRECFNKARLKPRIEGICEKCGKHFVTNYTTTNWIYTHRLQRRFCSVKCRDAGKRTIEKQCVQCGEIFYVRPSELKYNSCKYCSKQCQFAHMRGENSPFFDEKSKVSRICKVCKKSFTLERWRLNQKNHTGDFCSQKCHYKFVENPLAPLPPRQEKEYVRIKRKLLKEFPNCEQCGSNEQLEVDHKIAIAIAPELFKEPTNLQVLCKKCHKQKTKEDIRKVLALRAA